MEHSDSFLSLSDSYPPGKGGRETFLLPFSYRVMKSLLRGRRHRRRCGRSRSVGRRRKTGQSIGIDRLRELSEGEGEWMDGLAGELIKRMCEKGARFDHLSGDGRRTDSPMMVTVLDAPEGL